MTDQSAADLISLPQGGGAVKGLGESFQPDLHTGTGNFAVPLELPPGRGGLTPKLALSYSSGNGNGPLGLGWRLTGPGITRKTDKQIPKYLDGDTFVLSGAEDLVPVRGAAPGAQRFRPKTESLFARIEHHLDHTDHWTVWTKDGLRSTYGTPRPAAPGAGWHDPATVTDPTNAARVFEWLLTRTEDTFGNHIAYTYQPDPAASGTPQRYLDEIRYCDHGDPTDPSYLVTVKFQLEDRPDKITDRRPGFALTTTARYGAIETWTHADVDQKARSVELRYADRDRDPEDDAVSLLTSMTVTGHDGDKEPETLPPLELGYSRWEPELRRYRPVTGPVPPVSLATPGFELIDVFGTGVPDVVQLSGPGSRYWRNTGDCAVTLPRLFTSTPGGVTLGQPGVQVLDVDGDGRPDVLITDGLVAGSYSMDNHGGFDTAGFTRDRQAPSFSLTDPETRLVDLTGDGVSDVLHLGRDLVCFLNDRQAGWTEVRLADTPLRGLSFTDPRVRLADMTGDGLQDVVLVGNGHVRYWPNLGYGHFGPSVDMRQSPKFDDASSYGARGFDPARLLLGDVDGDGLADVVYIGIRGTTIWVNRAGTEFGRPAVVPGTPRPDSSASVRLVDFLGTGTAGILWTYDHRPQGDPPFKFLDVTGGIKPYLLTEIDNHMGGRTTIGYQSSTRFALADRVAGAPWRTTLPFPVQVVASVVSREEFSRSTTSSEFDYHHGYWDGEDREFRGFGRVDQRDTTIFDHDHDADLQPEHFSPPTETRTWFHSGPVGPGTGAWNELDLSDEYWPGDPDILGGGGRSSIPRDLPRRAMRDVIRCLRGSVLRTELYGLEGDPVTQSRPYTVSEHAYDLVPVIDPEENGDPSAVDDYWRAAPVVAVHPSVTRTTQWERGDDPMTRVSVNFEFDRYGNPVCTMEVAVPRGRNIAVAGDPGPELLVIVDIIGYAVRDDADHYICDRPSGRRSEEILNDGSQSLADLVRGVWQDASLPGRTLGFSHTRYDGDPFVGLPPGQLGDHGLVSATQTLAVTRGGLGSSFGAAMIPPYLDGTATRLATGLRGDYFSGDSLQDLAFSRADRYVAFNWDATAPDPYLSQRSFSVRWTGALRADHDGTYTLGLAGSGGARLWIDGTQVLDAWQGLSGASVPVPLIAGSHDLRLEYRAVDWMRSVALSWTSTSQPPEIIASAHFAPPSGFGPGTWHPSYPDAFRDSVPDCAGYRYHAGQNDGYEAGYYIVTGTQYGGRGLPIVQRDALGNEITIDYDDYSLFPGVVTDPAGMTRRAEYDYRVLKPSLVTDVNGNQTRGGYSPLGMLRWSAALGQPGKNQGDTIAQPGALYAYHLTAYDESAPDARQPLSVHVLKRVDYRWSIVDELNARRIKNGQQPLTSDEIAALFPTDELARYPDRFIQSRTFNDGAGRVLQTRTQSDTFVVDDLGLPADVTSAPTDLVAHVDGDLDSPPVVASGWKVYDNKGRVVQAWEPFFDKGWDYLEPTDVLAQMACTTTWYDCRGQQLRIVHPDGSEDTTVYGSVPELAQPAGYRPNAWEVVHYDGNDNAGRTSASTSQSWQTHWNTPSSSVMDPLGRVVGSVERLPDRGLVTTMSYDIQGRVTEVIDPLGRTVSSASYDLAGRAWRSTLLDAGLERIVHGATGSVLERRDAKGAVHLSSYDSLRRATAGWACDASGGAVTAREVMVYGDAAGLDDPEAGNLNGRPYRGYDEAGTVAVGEYDLAGRLLRSTRRVLSAATLLSVFPDPYMTDWQPETSDLHDLTALDGLASAVVDPTLYETQETWDALGRKKSTTTPPDYSGERHVVETMYTRSGALARLTLDGSQYVSQIAYNARGQRLAAWCGNGVLTRYAYDALTFRLRRQRSEKPPLAALSGRSAATSLQDAGYSYDLVGNPVTIQERSPLCGAGDKPTPNALDRTFRYDAIYRLLTATGREQKDPLPEVWSADPRSTDPTTTQSYDETYTYDDVGNLKTLKHHANSAGYARTMTLVADSNRLATMKTGTIVFAYDHDACGNMTTETESRHLGWDAANRLSSFRTQSSNETTPSQWATYKYDSSGRRVLRLVRKQGGRIEMSVYAGGPLERLLITEAGASAVAYDELHVLDNDVRVAVHRLNPLAHDHRPSVGYHLGDHLGNVVGTVDDQGVETNREEYLPYGESCFGSYARKRYRFTGKERDGESGLNYHLMRYYAPWLGRWVSSDPIGLADGHGSYTYCRGRPSVGRDPSGQRTEPSTHGTQELGPFLRSGRPSSTENQAELNFKRDVTDRQTLRQRSEFAKAPEPPLSLYKTESERSLDKGPLGYGLAWRGMEVLTGKSMTDTPVSRWEAAKGLAGSVLDWASLVELPASVGKLGMVVRYVSETRAILEAAQLASNIRVYRVVPVKELGSMIRAGQWVTTEGSLSGASADQVLNRLDLVGPTKLSPRYVNGENVLVEAETTTDNLKAPGLVGADEIGPYRSSYPTSTGHTGPPPEYVAVPEFQLRKSVEIPSQPTKPLLKLR